jgi:hypothetical protein
MESPKYFWYNEYITCVFKFMAEDLSHNQIPDVDMSHGALSDEKGKELYLSIFDKEIGCVMEQYRSVLGYPKNLSDAEVSLLLKNVRFRNVIDRSGGENWADKGAIEDAINNWDGDSNSGVEEKLLLIERIREGRGKVKNDTAYAGLEYLRKRFTGGLDLDMILERKLPDGGELWNIGCGGQALEIELALSDEYPEVTFHGVGLVDYSENVRKVLGLDDRVQFHDDNFYGIEFPQDRADLVISDRTFPYAHPNNTVLFFNRMHELAKEDGGGILLSDIYGQSFRSNRFQSLGEFLEYQSLRQDDDGERLYPTLRWGYNSDSDSSYWIYWERDMARHNQGNPFYDLEISGLGMYSKRGQESERLVNGVSYCEKEGILRRGMNVDQNQLYVDGAIEDYITNHFSVDENASDLVCYTYLDDEGNPLAGFKQLDSDTKLNSLYRDIQDEVEGKYITIEGIFTNKNVEEIEDSYWDIYVYYFRNHFPIVQISDEGDFDNAIMFDDDEENFKKLVA